MDLNGILRSSCRQKIIKVLSRCNSIMVTCLVRETNSTYNELMRNLVILEREGIVEIYHLGKHLYISLNRKNPKTSMILQAMKIIEQQDALYCNA